MRTISRRGIHGLLLLLVLSACSHRYELNVRFPGGSRITEGSPVLVDSIEAGSIESVRKERGAVIATVVIDRRHIWKSKIRQGIVATVRSDGRIDIDASRVAADAAALPSGTTIEGRREAWLEKALKRYATTQTIAAVAVGLLAVLVLVWLFRAIFRMGVVILSLLLSGVAAWVVHPFVVPLIEEHIYMRLEQMEKGGSPGFVDQGTPPRTAVTEKPGHEGGAPDGGQAPPADELTGTMGRAMDLITDIPLPHPKWLAFFLSWLAFFVIIQFVLGAALRATTSRK